MLQNPHADLITLESGTSHGLIAEGYWTQIYDSLDLGGSQHTVRRKREQILKSLSLFCASEYAHVFLWIPIGINPTRSLASSCHQLSLSESSMDYTIQERVNIQGLYKSHWLTFCV